MEHSNQMTIENARIIFRNFSGKESKFNREGDRNFCVVIPEEDVDGMKKSGWNVRTIEPREEGDSHLYYLPVAVAFGNFPPKIVMITSRAKTPIDESLVETLDFADFKNVDLIINPYNWEVNGKTGVKAYLKTLYVTINEDELELKYASDEYPPEDTHLPF